MKLLKSIGIFGVFYASQILSMIIVLVFKMSTDVDYFYELVDIMDTYSVASMEYLNKVMELVYISLILSDVLLLVPFSIYIKRKKINVISKIDIRSVTILFAIGIVVNFIVSFVVGILPESSSFVSSYNELMTLTLADNKLLAILTIGILAPILEELIFRFALINIFRQKGDRFAIIISALFFGVAHLNLVQSTYAFLIGLFLGYIYVKTSNLLPTIVIHLTINTSSLIYEYFSQFNNAFNCIIALCFIYLVVIYLEGGIKLNEKCFKSQ